MNWKEETCEKCIFRVEASCHIGPPTMLNPPFREEYFPNMYPLVSDEFFLTKKDEDAPVRYSKACAQYREFKPKGASVSQGTPLGDASAWSLRALKAFQLLGVSTVEELRTIKREDILRLKNIGMTTFREIQRGCMEHK